MSASSAAPAPTRFTTRTWSPSRKARSPTTTATPPASSSSMHCGCAWRPSGTRRRTSVSAVQLVVRVLVADLGLEEPALGLGVEERAVHLARYADIDIAIAVR